MNEGGTGRIPSKFAKGIGGLTMVLGSALVVMAFFPVKRFLSGGMEWMDYLITLIVVTLMVVPGALVVLGGYQFLREVNLPNLKVLVGVYSAFGTLWVFGTVSDRYPDVWHQSIDTGLFILTQAVLAILIYLLALRWLVPAMGMKWNGCRSVLGKGAFTLLAWLLWQVLFAVTREVFHITGGALWNDLIVLFGPIMVAWVFYKLGVRWLAAGQQVQTAPTP